PEALSEIVPGLLEATPTDFMDGKPLRYRRTEDGHFVLYSVGLDCADDGGEMRRPSQRGLLQAASPDLGFRQGMDLVWPRPASDAEAQRLREDERRAEEEQIARAEEIET